MHAPTQAEARAQAFQRFVDCVEIARACATHQRACHDIRKPAFGLRFVDAAHLHQPVDNH